LSCELINVRCICFFHSNFITPTYAYVAHRNFILRSYDVNRRAANVKKTGKRRRENDGSVVMTLVSSGTMSLQLSRFAIDDEASIFCVRRRRFGSNDRTSSNRIDQKAGMNPLSRSIPRRTCIVFDALLLDLRKAVATTVVPLRSEVREMRHVARPSVSLFE
jgi:hypothetical protein